MDCGASREPEAAIGGRCGRASRLRRVVLPLHLLARYVRVSARIYALSALDQVDLASPTPSYPECHVPLEVAIAMSK